MIEVAIRKMSDRDLKTEYRLASREDRAFDSIAIRIRLVCRVEADRRRLQLEESR